MCMGWSTSLILCATLLPGQPAAKEYHRDFRGGRPLDSALKRIGPDAQLVTRLEPEGLRITLPPGRKTPGQPVGVAAKFRLAGDFEITGVYELLSAEPPVKGN